MRSSGRNLREYVAVHGCVRALTTAVVAVMRPWPWWSPPPGLTPTPGTLRLLLTIPARAEARRLRAAGAPLKSSYRKLSSLKERAGVKEVSACGFAAVVGLQGMATWPHGCFP